MRAVSPLVATGVLLVITLVGGVLIYNFVVKSLTSTKEYALVTLVSARAVNIGDRVVLSLKVSNIGTARAELYEIELIPLNLTKRIDIVVEPGVTRGFNVVFDNVAPRTRCFLVIRYNGGETEPYPIAIE